MSTKRKPLNPLQDWMWFCQDVVLKRIRSTPRERAMAAMLLAIITSPVSVREIAKRRGKK